MGHQCPTVGEWRMMLLPRWPGSFSKDCYYKYSPAWVGKCSQRPPLSLWRTLMTHICGTLVSHRRVFTFPKVGNEGYIAKLSLQGWSGHKECLLSPDNWTAYLNSSLFFCESALNTSLRICANRSLQNQKVSILSNMLVKLSNPDVAILIIQQQSTVAVLNSCLCHANDE